MFLEIQKIKIAVTSDCTLRCSHCNINKNAHLVIDLPKAKKAVYLLLNSKGNYKRLELYGGEPFTKFKLIKEIVNYAKKLNKKIKKKLSVSIATNATVINKDIINWIKDNKINISISYSGSAESHNYNRKFSDNTGSYDRVKKNIKNLLKNIPSEYIVCLYCVDSHFVKNMINDFKNIIEIGFKIINIECVSGCGWKYNDYKLFKRNIKDILNTVKKEIEKGNYIYFEPFIELIRNYGKYDTECPLYRDIEMYPDGNYGFYPYGFINYEKVKEKVKIGDYKKGIYKKYIKCDKNCQKCLSDYYVFTELYDGSYAYKIRTVYIKKLFIELLKNKGKKNISDYFEKLSKILNITYV